MNIFQYTPRMNAPISSEALIKDLRLVAAQRGFKTLTKSTYNKYGKYNAETISRRFSNSWNKALHQAGLEPSKVPQHSDDALFENFLNTWQAKGAQPTQNDLNNPPSTIRAITYVRRFGSWETAVRSFISFANAKEATIDVLRTAKLKKRKTPRTASWRLRFQILSRDHFTCVRCGQSPSKDPNVILHIDHIKPYSRGGETEISNLATLCSKCNLGKGDWVDRDK